MKRCHKMKVYKRTTALEPDRNGYILPQKPEIRIVGKWLENAGFKCGDQIYVLINGRGQLVIEDEQTHFLLRT